jgi:hypothetical protein
MIPNFGATGYVDSQPCNGVWRCNNTITRGHLRGHYCATGREAQCRTIEYHSRAAQRRFVLNALNSVEHRPANRCGWDNHKAITKITDPTLPILRVPQSIGSRDDVFKRRSKRKIRRLER